MKCCDRKKIRSEEELKKLINRLNRIEGQIRGLKMMVENNAYCIDILTQVAAADAALNSFSKELLAEHFKSCVVNDVLNGEFESVDEFILTMKKFMK